VPIVIKYGSLNLLELSGPVQACNGAVLPLPLPYFYSRLGRPQGHSATGTVISMKNSSDTIGSRTRHLTSSLVPQPTGRPRVTLIERLVNVSCSKLQETEVRDRAR
jgi:hypothetical protein